MHCCMITIYSNVFIIIVITVPLYILLYGIMQAYTVKFNFEGINLIINTSVGDIHMHRRRKQM